VIQAAVDAELDSSFNDISRTIAMANGGVVPSREIKGGMSIGEKIGKYISSAFSIALESSAAKVLQNLNQEFNLEGGPPGGMFDGGPGGGPVTQDQQEAFEKIRKIAEKVGSPNPAVTAAIAMLETGWLSNPNSVYFASGKTNPFGQTGRGPRGSVIGADGQEHAVYNNLEEGVKAHVDRWKSSYIGKTPQEIIESIRTGRGAAAPGMYNVSPTWTSKVLSTYQSGTQPQPSSTPSRGAAAAVLPRGNPVFTSGFGSRWGRQHRGIDIGVDANSPVTALQDGEVIDIYRSFGGHGDGVVVRHSDGTKLVYGHVNSKVQVGDKIKKGQTIATVKGWFNAYGNKDNTHLHLERYVGGAAQDPTGFLNSILQQKQKAQRQASLAPSQQSREIASLQQSPSYALVENNTILYQKEFVLT
jgi:cyclophilin family peptidyl-prolyl cis-trans isomerase